jgi:hypothetical protein
VAKTNAGLRINTYTISKKTTIVWNFPIALVGALCDPYPTKMSLLSLAYY